jgi:hypothetical protein
MVSNFLLPAKELIGTLLHRTLVLNIFMAAIQTFIKHATEAVLTKVFYM